MHAAPFGRPLHAPAPVQVLAPLHSLLGSAPMLIGAHVPSGWPVLVWAQPWQTPLQGRSQQTPSWVGQLLLWHCEPVPLQEAPLGFSAQLLPTQRVCPEHSLSGSVPLTTAPQVPVARPVLADVQA